MDATEHLEASLEAAIALANSFGAPFRQGRRRGDGKPMRAGDDAAGIAAVEEVLRLTTNRLPEIDAEALSAFASGGARLYAALDQLVDGGVDAAAEALNNLLESTQAMPRLIRREDLPWHLHFVSPGVSAATGWLAEFTTAAAMLLGSGQLELLRRCDAERCDNLFLDATRNHTQRFCSTPCQNRTKVAAFRARTA